MTRGEDEFLRFAAQLATDTTLITALLDAHPALDGPCPACRVPPGRPPIVAPCPIRSVAALALQLRADRGATS